MTDKEIIKALECCGIDNCDECPCYIEEWGCDQNLQLMALDLINRQKSQILKEQNKNSKLRNERNHLKAELEEKTKKLQEILPIVAKLKADAVKEFVKRIKADAGWLCDDSYIENALIEYVDNLVKEMVGETK